MATILVKAESVLVAANRMMNDLAEELGRGDFDGKGPEAAMRALAINAEIRKAVHLLFAADGTQEAAPPTLEIQ